MNINVLRTFFEKVAQLRTTDESTPPDHLLVKVAVCAKFPSLEKKSWDWGKFREGIVDEGIPLAGATVGAGMGGLRGAALGYAAGGGLSLLRSKLKGEKPSTTRKLLAAGALGYGGGGLMHAGLAHLTRDAAKGGLAHRLFRTHGVSSRLMEEALPAAGATLATGIATGSSD
jgi:hypothetical protein